MTTERKILSLLYHVQEMQQARDALETSLYYLQGELPKIRKALNEKYELDFLLENLEAEVANADLESLTEFITDLENEIHELSYNFKQASEKLRIATHLHKPNSPLSYTPVKGVKK